MQRLRISASLRLCAGILSFAVAPSAFAGVKLATPFADGMVLQRDARTAVWGTAAPGERVTVEFAGQRIGATAGADGRWLVRLAPMAASKEGRVLRANDAVVTDVLVGEVWFCCGQSNAELPLVGQPHYSDREGRLVAAITRFDDVRYVNAGSNRWSPVPRREAQCRVVWRRFHPENLGRAPSFSAMGVHFALALRNALDVPIGIVGAYCGGTNIDAWTPRAGYETASASLAETRDFPVAGPGEWTDDMKKGPVSGPNQQPTVLWNEMVAPWCPMSMRGVIWYQGEHNAAEGALYCDKMHALYDGWSRMFENPGLKLYFVQLAPWSNSWWGIHLAQTKFAAEEPNAGMVTTADIGNGRSIHPADKGPVGRRLAALALKRDYGFSGIVADSPTIRAVRAEGDRLVLDFNDADGWYIYSDDRGDPVPFELAGEDGEYRPARIMNAAYGGQKAESPGVEPGQVAGRELVLRAEGVPRPVKVRYLFQRPWTSALFATSGLPPGPFEADARMGDLVAYVEGRLATGERAIVVPKGDYRLALPEGRAAYFSLTRLADVTIDFSGSRLWGETKARMFDIAHCTNLVIRNVTVDYPFDLPFTQAEIVEVDAERSWRVRVIPGYPCPDEAQLAARIWPVQAYSRDGERLVNPMRFREGIRIERLGADEYRVSGGIDRRGDIGDIAVWSVAETRRRTSDAALRSQGCAGCLFEDISVYSTPFGCGFLEFDADGNAYRRCRLVRCPQEDDPVSRGLKRLRSGNHDAFNSRRSFRGPTLESCRFAWHCDDCVNISGFYALVAGREGRTLRVLSSSASAPCAPGDTCQAMTFEGACPPDVTVASVTPDGEPTEDDRALIAGMNFWPGLDKSFRWAWKVEVSEDVDLPPKSVIISNRRQGSGFVVRDCEFGPNRARALQLKASDGLIERTKIHGTEMCGIDISTEPIPFMEGGCSRNVTIRDCTVEDCGGGIVISGITGSRAPLPAGAHRDIRIAGSRVSSPAPALKAVGCLGLILSDNVFQANGGEAVQLVNCPPNLQMQNR